MTNPSRVTPGGEKEICICAAIKTVEGLVIRGHRHDGCLIYAAGIPVVDETQLCHAVQGFVTSRNRFVGREEAVELQLAAGVPCYRGTHYGNILTSEDLY